MMDSKPALSSKHIEATAKLLKSVLPICGVCGQTLSGHLFKSIAQTPIEKNNPERALALLAAVKRCNWDEILNFQEFNGLLDVIEVVALKCLNGKCSLATYISRFELYASDEFLNQQPIPDCSGPTADGYEGAI
jgi:hypothetical protein